MREIVVECVPGLRDVTRDEILRARPETVRFLTPYRKDDLLLVTSSADWKKELRTAVSLYERLNFNVPRPRALLGDQSFRTLLTAVQNIKTEDEFKSFSLHGAGNETSPFIRMSEKLANATGMFFSSGEADMVIRIIPAEVSGWDILIRLTRRPLTVRTWRVCQMDGAVNAAIASAMIALSSPSEKDIFLNLMAGSGTLMIERALASPFGKIIGGDIDSEALNCSRRNIIAAGLSEKVDLVWMDATATGLEESSADVICVDPPWGTHLGKNDDIRLLYLGLFREIERVLKRRGRALVLSAARVLVRDILKDSFPSLICKREIPVVQRGLSPVIFVIEKA